MRIAPVALVALSLGACRRSDDASGADTTTKTEATPTAEVAAPQRTNLLQNPSFEHGREPWFSLAGPESEFWADFEVTDERAKDGRHSAVLRLSSEGHVPQVRVYGLIAERGPGVLPARVSGYYRVEDWQRGTELTYVQVVVAVNGATNMPEPEIPNQLAWVLTGIDVPPFEIRNRRFIFTGSREPTQNEWVRFELPLREGWERLWGAVPVEYESMRVFFEARYDGRQPDDGPVRANVYFDDLYLGD